MRLGTANDPVRAARSRRVLVLWCLVFVSGIASAQLAPWQRDKGPPPVFPEVCVPTSWLEARTQGERIVCVDARPVHEYLEGHLPGAVSLPADSLPAEPSAVTSVFREELARRGLAPGDTLLCYGASGSLRDVARLYWRLAEAGAYRIRILDGGYEAWRRRGLPCPRTADRRPAARWDAETDRSVYADAAYVEQRYGEPGYEILDARASGSLQTVELIETSGTTWRRGHIPHSLPVDFRAMLGDDGVFPAPDALRSLIESIGARPGTTVDTAAEFIVYDDGRPHSGALGCLLLHMAGIARVRYFRGGWPEWTESPRRPVVRLIDAEDVRARMYAEDRAPTDGLPPSTFLLLDVRSELGFGRNHIPGSVNLATAQMPDSLDTLLNRHWPAADPLRIPVITYCWGSSCIRSRDGGTRMARLGFRNIEWFRDGLEAWEDLGEPIIGESIRRPPRGAARPDSLRHRPAPAGTGRRR